MSDIPYLPPYADEPEDAVPRTADPASWLPRWVQSRHDPALAPVPAPAPAVEAPDLPVPAETAAPEALAAEAPAPDVRPTSGPVAHFHHKVGVVASVIEQLIIETRKQDVLEGEELNRAALRAQPFVSSAWEGLWGMAVDPATEELRASVLVVLAPRAVGATTFALRLLADHTPPHAALVKLQADWKAPSRLRLPLERWHAFQLDLKAPTTDRVTADFVASLAKHAENLSACNSVLVLTVDQEIWDASLASPAGVQVLRLTDSPDAAAVVESHLRAGGHHEAADEVQASGEADNRLRGLNAVAAVRATHRIVAAWEEYRHQRQAPVPQRSGAAGVQVKSFEELMLEALSDWQGELDGLFGDHTGDAGPAERSLAVEDRYLLLALAVRQSAPVSLVSDGARQLQEAVESVSSSPAVGKAARAAFAARGLRRRIHDVGATVDGRDVVRFDRPAYGRAVLEYVWDNYEAMRAPLLVWLAKLVPRPADPKDPVVRTLASLALRHGTREYLVKLPESTDPELLGAVLRSVVHDEQVGSLVWATLYQWAKTDSGAPTVVSTCRLVLGAPEVSPAAARMAVVRLRRVASRAATDPAVRRSVLTAFEEFAGQPAGRARLLAEVAGWQQSKVPPAAGSLAFLALMSVHSPGLPWLLSDDASDVDVQGALAELLAGPETAMETIPRITDWIRCCADDSAGYAQLRDQLLVPLRGHRMFQAGMDLMKALTGSVTAQGVDIAEDFYQHLVGGPLQGLFAPDGAAR